MELIQFEERYRQPLLEVWNQSLVQDPISPDIFRRKVLEDENFDPALALLACEKGEVTGFLLAMYRRTPYLNRGLEPKTGWITAMGVLPEHRGRGIGGALLARAEELLAARGASRVILGAYSPNYFFPGVDIEGHAMAAALMEKRGYAPGETAYSMYRLLFGYQIPQAVLEKEKKALEAGFRFMLYKEKYRQALLDFLEKHFSAGWQYNAMQLIQAGLAEEQIWLCTDKDGQVAGYCQRGMDANPSRFGPFGVGESHRNHSLGSILFCRMLYDMACRGIYLVYFLSTDDPGARFYRRQGLEVFRTFRRYEKEL